MPLATAATVAASASQTQMPRRGPAWPAVLKPPIAAAPSTSAGTAKPMSPTSTPITGSRNGPTAIAQTNSAEMSLGAVAAVGWLPELANATHIDGCQVPLETKDAVAESGPMEFVHRCHFCDWQRLASSPTILEPHCEQCGSLLDSGRLHELAPPG